MPAASELDIDGRKVRVTNLPKVLYPGCGFTKAQVIDYYACIADVLLPHLQKRPVTLKRYPDVWPRNSSTKRTHPRTARRG